MQAPGRANTGNSRKVEEKFAFHGEGGKILNWLLSEAVESVAGDTENPTRNILSNLLSSDPWP